MITKGEACRAMSDVILQCYLSRLLSNVLMVLGMIGFWLVIYKVSGII